MPRRMLIAIITIIILTLVIEANIWVKHEFASSTLSASKTQPPRTRQDTIEGNASSENKAFQKCIGVSSVYCRLGYPIIARPGFNISYSVRACNSTYVIGYAKYDILGLEEALKKALNVLGGNYSLVLADSGPGNIVNSTLVKHPEWVLVLSKTYKRYRLWPYGCCGDTRIIVDALNGSISVDYEANYAVPQKEIELPDPEELTRINVTQLVIDTFQQVLKHYHGLWEETLRWILDSGVPYRYVVDLRIAVLGTGNNLALSNESIVAKEFIGKPRLYWVIYIGIPEAHVRLTALVDAATNKLASYVIEPLWPATPWATVVAEPVYPDKPVTVSIDVKGLGETAIVLNKAYRVEPGEEGELAVKLYWKTYGAEDIGEPPQVIVVPEPLAKNWIKIEPTNTSIVVDFRKTKSYELLYRYRVSKNAPAGIHVLTLHVLVKYAGRKASSRSLCVPVVLVIRGAS
jgi:hypothetical protein